SRLAPSDYHLQAAARGRLSNSARTHERDPQNRDSRAGSPLRLHRPGPGTVDNRVLMVASLRPGHAAQNRVPNWLHAEPDAPARAPRSRIGLRHAGSDKTSPHERNDIPPGKEHVGSG